MTTHYEAEYHSEKYGYYSIGFTAKDQQDADKYASQRRRMAMQNDPTVHTVNVDKVEVTK
jgi:hypothetical protein